MKRSVSIVKSIFTFSTWRRLFAATDKAPETNPNFSPETPPNFRGQTTLETATDSDIESSLYIGPPFSQVTADDKRALDCPETPLQKVEFMPGDRVTYQPYEEAFEAQVLELHYEAIKNSRRFWYRLACPTLFTFPVDCTGRCIRQSQYYVDDSKYDPFNEGA